MSEETKAAAPPTAQTVREWKAKAENCFMTSSLDEYCPSEFIELADAYLALLAGPQIMEDVKTAVVPGNVLEAIAHNVCSLHGFDPAFVAGQERFAKAIITEYLRAAPLPGGLEDVARVIREYLDFVGKTLPRDEAELSGIKDCLALECANRLAGSRPSSPVVPTEQAEGAVVGWRPIESAPRDGTKIDICFEGHRVADAYWSGGNKRGKWYAPGWDYDGFDGVVASGKDPAVTHWMPVPAPPPASVSPGTEGGQ